MIRTKGIIDASTSIAKVSPKVSSTLDSCIELIDEPEKITEPASVHMENIINYIGGFIVRKFKK